MKTANPTSHSHPLHTLRRLLVALTALLAVTAVLGGCESDPMGPSDSTPSLAVRSVTLDQTSINLEPGQTLKLIATVNADEGLDRTVVWSSTNPDVASVSGNGLVEALTVGSTKIIATSSADEEKFAEAGVSVNAPAATIDNVTIPTTAGSLHEGENLQLEAQVEHTGDIDTSVSWFSSKPDVASVDATGKVTGHRAGSTVIEARSNADDSKRAMKAIEVLAAEVTEVNISGGADEVFVDDQVQLGASVSGRGSIDDTVQWFSSNPDAASVENGLVTALAAGEVVITAKSASHPGVSDTITLNIEQFNTAYYYRLTNMFLGEGRALDTYGDTHRPFMGDTGNYSGQSWRLTKLSGGRYRLSNMFLGEGRSLDTYSDTHRPFMGETGGYLGQFWTLTPLGNGYYRLTNDFLGAGRSLDTYSSTSNEPFMGETGNYSGQFWKLTKLQEI